MKTQTTMKYLSSALFLILMIVSSCKKKEDPKPNPTANTDNAVMADVNIPQTVSVLTNDTYNGNPTITASTESKYGTVIVNSDKTITYTPFYNFYGTAVINYTLKDDNGSSGGTVLIKRGTAAQERTATIINAFVPAPSATTVALFLYSIDGDSTQAEIYSVDYGRYHIDYGNYYSKKLDIDSKGIMPDIWLNTFTIAADGMVVVKANNNTTVIFEVVDYFTASAKKQDFSGEMTVKGYTIKYNGHVLAYTTEVL